MKISGRAQGAPTHELRDSNGQIAVTTCDLSYNVNNVLWKTDAKTTCQVCLSLKQNPGTKP